MSNDPSPEIPKVPGPVAVTGAGGYIASWIVKLLLDGGHTVHATVRDPSNEKKVGHLRQLAEGAPGELKLFAADLLEAGSFDEAIAGCATVMHTASPFFLAGIKDAQKQMVEPALQGTENVLDAVERSGTVRRVVLTSSVAAVYGDNIDLEAAGGQLSDQHWNETSTANHNPYSYSKTVAERAAWKRCEAQPDDANQRWDLVTINPSMVYGPPLGKRLDGTTNALMYDLARGKLWYGGPRLTFGVVDVRDVALAHLLAGANPDASGRYLMAERIVSLVEIGQRMRSLFDNKYRSPTRYLPNALIYLAGPSEGLTWTYLRKNLGLPVSFDDRRVREHLGLRYHDLDDTIRDHVERLVEQGHLS